MTARPLNTTELADRLGVSRDWLYRPQNLERLYAEGMPRPISTRGQRRWDRNSVLAWLGRNHPLARPVANDFAAPAPAPNDAANWQRQLANVYRQHT